MSFSGKMKYIFDIFSIILPSKTPRDLIFFVTARCNAKCPHCLYRKQVDDQSRILQELKLEEIEKIARNYGRLVKLSISGGEPFIRKDLAQIIQLFDKYCQPSIIDIPTNGSLPEIAEKTVKEILKICRVPVLEIQLSLDGPKGIFEEISGIPDNYEKLFETFRRLEKIRQTDQRLKIKMNFTYVPQNKQYAQPLVFKLNQNYAFDRIQITFPHGHHIKNTVIDKLFYEEFYNLSKKINLEVKPPSIWDWHSLIFRAIKMMRDDFLLKRIKNSDMGQFCDAGKKMIVIDDIGNVYPCEPLWSEVGNLRDTNFNMPIIVKNETYRSFREKYLGKNKCNCTWGNIAMDAIIHNPLYWPKILFYTFKIFFYHAL
ncbi:MAG: radical SAM protein [Candidatus Portnoybacteria bacterium]|nr:radical SAM protein [Candidatus Portnoybacteria bacterium]